MIMHTISEVRSWKIKTFNKLHLHNEAHDPCICTLHLGETIFLRAEWFREAYNIIHVRPVSSHPASSVHRCVVSCGGISVLWTHV